MGAPVLDGPIGVGLDAAKREEMHLFDTKIRMCGLVMCKRLDDVYRFIGQQQFRDIHRALLPVSLGALVACEEEVQGRFVRCTRSGWLVADQLQPVREYADDPATVAEKYMYTPYLWGGRESLGIDCSGLVQHAFNACGIPAPRDSDMQSVWLGTPIENWTEPGKLQRNDLVFWKGHVGIMLNDTQLLHANGHHMGVAAEPLTEAIVRIRPQHGEPTQARRVDPFAEATMSPVWKTTA